MNTLVPEADPVSSNDVKVNILSAVNVAAQMNTNACPLHGSDDSPVKQRGGPIEISSRYQLKIQKSRKVKEMHSILTNKVLLETFPRVEAIPQAHSDGVEPLHRRNEVQDTTAIRAIVEDREEKRHDHSKQSKTARRLGSRVQMAIASLGFH
jgi:hypothetical protein